MQSVLCSQCGAHIAFINTAEALPPGAPLFMNTILTCQLCHAERVALEHALGWRRTDAALPDFDNPDACYRLWERQNESANVCRVLREWMAHSKYAMPETPVPKINLFRQENT